MRTFTVIALLSATALAESPRQVTWTGWFADADCGSGRFSTATLTPPNPDCAQKCIEKGVAPVLLSEQARAAFQVKGYAGVIENLGYHLEITGQFDEAARTIAVRTVKRLSDYQGAACARPKQQP